ncbi:MAG: DUF302 domain-containing protein [Euryarchaeota archaeon]|nr:DUF302 domain-containing protein [Euryarchaeota archaeon]MDE1837536.1 DUF302 domain-containing protein [Euryarchaeota archaeon]MDE1880017.1 DUF302 domain-containing protein [Euryarchaeota archaeon]MDE2046154.1 DUF302 domain-containing protein [Thermoplasmata archaeon]
MSSLDLSVEYPGTVDGAVRALEERLKAEGFGILATLRVHDTLQEKLGAVIDPIVILDVCSPRQAKRALEISRDAAWLLPCKIVVSLEKGKTRISLVRPTTLIRSLMPSKEFESLAEEVEVGLQNAVKAAAVPRAP